ncbi:MAG: DUF6807 domain-containing protein [Limisphaerales bacterium]
MHLRIALFGLALSCFIGSASAAVAPTIKVEQSESNLIVRALAPGGKNWVNLATYVAQPGSRPYLHPVHDASGRQILTQDRPDDHPWQHGIFTGFHRVNGINYWKEDEGRQRLVRISDVTQESNKVSWKSLIELVAPDGKVVLQEENIITIHAPESRDAYRIDFSLVLQAKDIDVQFGKFFVGGLSVRMPWDKSNPRQAHLNSNGLRGRAGEQQRAAWCMVERPFGDEIFGIAIFDHPRNANHPPAWRVDEQGLINPNISGLSDWSLKAGESRRFDYAVLIYRGPATKELLDEFASRMSR